jgi:SOS-response transcriptional repressor LexA
MEYSPGILVNTPRTTPDGRLILEWLTDRQYEALLAISRFVNEKRYYPTSREVGELLDRPEDPCSQQRALQLINALVRKGYLTKGRGHRSMVLTEAAIEKLQQDQEGVQPGLPGM